MTDALADRLCRALEEREAVVAVVGQGYVGLSVAAAAAEAGFAVVGIDADPERVAGLDQGELVVPGVDADLFATATSSGRLHFSTDAKDVADADVVLICVPTPLIDHRPDLSAVEQAGRDVGEHLTPGTLVVLESTTYPGTTDDVLRPLLEAGGLQVGPDVLLAYSPERIDPGNHRFGFRGVPRVVGGHTLAAARAAAAFYGALVDHVQVVSSTRAAELAKLLENTFRMVNIALVNELAQLCADQGIDTWEVIDAADTKPFGFMRFEPGPGVGGHCIPLDPAYLSWQSRRDTGRPFRLVELAKDVNDQMPHYVARRIGDLLNDHGKAVRGSRLLVLGVTYKPDVGDVRESAALQVIGHLQALGAQIAFHDPFVEAVDHYGVQLARTTLDEAALQAADAVLLLTPHRSYDLGWLADNAPLVFDARGAMRAWRSDRVHVL